MSANNGIHVSIEDAPGAHYTHDFLFHVNPDPAFTYLLGRQNGVLQRDIEVEWESGLAQADRRDNPAVEIKVFAWDANGAAAPNVTFKLAMSS